MRNTVFVASVAAVVAAVVTVLAMEYSGLRPGVSSAADGGSPAGDVGGEIKGDVDCNQGIEAVDALKLLQEIAAFDYTQNDPCTPVGELIHGEPIPGPQGPPGPAGPQGEQGAPGVSGWERVVSEGNLDSIVSKGNGVACPEGKVALGGGGQVIDTVAKVGLVYSVPTSNGGWSSAAREMVETSDEWGITTWAICAFVEE